MPDTLRVWSLQRRVTLISAIAVGTALVLGVIGMEWAEKIEDRQMLDARLEQLSETILSLLGPKKFTTGTVEAARNLQLNTGPKAKAVYSYQVWSRDGTLLLQSQEAPTTQPLTPLANSGFETRSVMGEEYRIFSLSANDGSLVVQVAEPLTERMDDIGMIIAYYLVSLVLPFGLAMGATRFLLHGSFRSLNTLAGRMRQHHLLDDRPVQIDKPPREILPVVRALNSLLRRVGNAIAAEHRFTSVAAHELRTPLAGIRAQAQLACKAETDEELQEALQSIIKGVDRAARVFDQLFDLTRMESLSKDVNESFQHVSLSAVCQQVLEDVESKFAAKRISISVNLIDDSIQGLDFAIYLLMLNLISNAILYTPESGVIEIGSQRQGEAVVLTVDDSGRGIPAEARERAFERFNRLDQHGPEGVGLGLSIVAQIVELHHAHIQLQDSSLGGLRVRVSFERPD